MALDSPGCGRRKRHNGDNRTSHAHRRLKPLGNTQKRAYSQESAQDEIAGQDCPESQYDIFRHEASIIPYFEN
jgi:hypothetical protein